MFAISLVVLAGMLPVVVHGASDSAAYIDSHLDRDHNGVEDLLDQWLQGKRSWAQLRQAVAPVRSSKMESRAFAGKTPPAQAVWSQGLLRLICLGGDRQSVDRAQETALASGTCRLLHDLDEFGGVQVLALDEPALRAFLKHPPAGRLVLDRDGTAALTASVRQMGGRQAQVGPWKLGGDWSATVAILDSGCDTAHDDLGDLNSDNLDGPPPRVGDALDWSDAAAGWPLGAGYRIVGWHDVTDDYPEAQGPWDYHYHGTALASVVAGGGRIDFDHRGVNPVGRMTIVKYYDFDEQWHTWAGDFLAACAWTLEHRQLYRVRVVLSAVNWDQDLGISDAMREMLEVGLLPVVAMGNYGPQVAAPGFPAAVPEVLTVGSVNDLGGVSAFSGRGLPGQGKPDLLAPGGGLLETGGRIDAADNEPDDSYSGRSGTSLSAAHVAGAVYMLEEALQDNGLHLPPDAQAARTVRALLKATSARVDSEENPAGTELWPLPAPEFPDEIRGWGLLRIDAAVQAVLQPLLPGTDQVDTLTLDEQKTVIARRVLLEPGVRYLLEAVPGTDLDVDLALVNPRLLDFDSYGERVDRRNDAGTGVSEFIFHQGGQADWQFLVVRRVSGQGVVTLRLREADDFPQQGSVVELPGVVSAPPNTGVLAGAAGTSVVIPSFVSLDPQARSVDVLDGWGFELPGWPVFVFPHPSSQGGLNQPLVWDLAPDPGDEIVLSSAYGSVYFFNALGAYQEVELAFNLPLTAPVGLQLADGTRQVAVVDDHGELRFFSWGPVLEGVHDLGHDDPLQPAVARLFPEAEERLVVAFADGTLTVVGSDGQPRPGWPLDLGSPLTLPPILADTDADGSREILIPVFDEDAGTLVLRHFLFDGQPAPADQSLLPSPTGGPWLQLSWPLMAGDTLDGRLRLEMIGLAGNGQSGVDAHWDLARVGWSASNQSFQETMPSLQVSATTSQGVLQLTKVLMAPPLAFDFEGGPGSEIQLLAGFRWEELLYGQTALPGSALGCFQAPHQGRPLVGRFPLAPGGGDALLGTNVGAVMVPIAGDLFYQVRVLDRQAHFLTMHAGQQGYHAWPSARADQRNSGAYPLAADPSPVAVEVTGRARLSAYPNPGAGHFKFSWPGAAESEEIQIDIFDLRGRLVKQIRGLAGQENLFWDGRDQGGRSVGGGAYLAVGRWQGKRAVTRLLVTH